MITLLFYLIYKPKVDNSVIFYHLAKLCLKLGTVGLIFVVGNILYIVLCKGVENTLADGTSSAQTVTAILE